MLFNADNFLKMMKKSAMDAFIASKPTDIAFGKVISAKPLKIQIDQKLILTSTMLVLTRNVTDYKDEKEFLIHNALKNGDQVLLIRQSGGQKYIVLDRIGKA